MPKRQVAARRRAAEVRFALTASLKPPQPLRYILRLPR
jgi:hypothetical protein